MAVARPTSTLSSEERSARVDQLVLDVKAVAARTGKLMDDVRGVIARLNENEIIARSARNQVAEFKSMTFMGRLRWLFRG